MLTVTYSIDDKFWMNTQTVDRNPGGTTLSYFYAAAILFAAQVMWSCDRVDVSQLPAHTKVCSLERPDVCYEIKP